MNWKGLITGYGLTDEDGQPSKILLGAEVPILSAQRCNRVTEHNKYDTIIDDSQICAGYMDGGVDHCYVSYLGHLIYSSLKLTWK